MTALVAIALFAAASAGTPARTLESAFPTPKGFTRVPEAKGSFGAFLRQLALEEPGTAVRAFDGSVVHEGSDPRIAAVAALDVGSRDLQQCADSVIRLDAEWRWQANGSDAIAYRLTNGDLVKWKDWAAGQRPRVAGRKLTWSQAARPDGSYRAFRGYLEFVFTYAGTRSLWAYAKPVPRAALRPGDFFVLPAERGTGHAVLVLDVAEDGKGHRIALVGQGYMPAQSFQVLAASPGQAWISLDGEKLQTPFWAPFPWSSLRRLP